MNVADQHLVIVACQQAVNRFYMGLDSSDMDAVAAAMATEGIWHRQGQALRGSDAVRQALAQRPAGRNTAHLVQNLVVHVESPSSARATYFTLVYRFDAAEPVAAPVPLGAPLSISLNEDRLLRDEQGAWKFLEKQSQRRFVA